MIEEDNILAKILADADVSNFGRKDFNEKSEQVFQELVAMGKVADTPEARTKFDKSKQNMLATHQWQTKAALKFRGEQQQKNLESLKGLA